jgi:hypothetical protein
MDSGRRVRPHVAGDQPVHGHHERPGRLLEVPVNPITGTKFENAKSTKMVHIAEFTADLIKHGKLDWTPAATTTKSSPSMIPATRPGAWACSTNRAMSFRTCANHFYEMPANTIREQTFCCGSGSGLNAGEDMELRWPAGCPGQCGQTCAREIRRQHAGHHLRHRPGGPAASMEYWVPEVEVTGASRTGGQRPDHAG